MNMTEPSRPFDLAKIDVEAIRKQRRKQLLLYSLPVIIVCLFVCVKLLGMVGLTQLAIGSYNRGDFNGSSNSLATVHFLNVIEPYKVDFNEGTSELQAADYTRAQTLLSQALKTVPKSDECQVRVNLVYAYTRPAEAAFGDKKYDDAILLYDKAKAIIDARDCGLTVAALAKTASKETKQADKKLQDLKQSVAEKQDAAKRARNSDDAKEGKSSNDESSNSSSDSQSTNQSQIEKLEQQQANNNKATREEQQRSRESEKSLNSRKYDQKTW